MKSKQEILNLAVKRKIYEGYQKITIETDEENPTAIAVFTDDEIQIADGYRVRMTPEY